ncbi:MAG: (2Fe-2S)-binding protein [Deltaproteobacteria bacterium]|nr:(2Fe-2S)-binding protein [Deltaproteobacteria bacterium]
MTTITVDDKSIEAREGTTVLQACLENGIYIPNLCHMDGMAHPPASCRLCLVEVEGEDRPVTSCTTAAANGLAVRTDTPEVRRLQRTALQLLLSVHDVDCGRCPANKKCELQRMAAFLKVGLKPKRLERFLKEPGIDRTHPFLDYYPNRCVLCGRCAVVCTKEHGRAYLTFAKRGLDTVLSFFGEEDVSVTPCQNRFPCVGVCPVGALVPKSNHEIHEIHEK